MDIEKILQQFDVDINKATNCDELTEIRQNYLGKAGHLSQVMRMMKDIATSERKSFGEKVNNAKDRVESLLRTKKEELEKLAIENELKNAKIVDLTVPCSENVGSLHPITIVQERIVEIFKSMGFSVEDGDEIETEYNNFESVNVPKNHPARDMQDTFYLDNGELLKTQTSAGQNKIMRKYGAPLRVIFPGRCFRNEELDASHENTFFYLFGMMIDENISISNLIYFMKTMLSNVFGKNVEVRLRPGFFPFVEPGFELDCSCPYCGGHGCNVCKHSGWIELCPCGMIHPKVLEMGGIDTDKYQGFAFGLGLSRLTMMTFDIDDIRKLNSGELKTLKQVKVK